MKSGTRLGPYEVLAPLGAGGMGEVYRAKDTRLDRTVAIKVLPTHLSKDPELRQRFEREARAISALQHPNICTLYDVGVQDDVDFLVMELLDGQTLAERLTKGALPIAQAVTIAIEIAQALQDAHRRGIVHRDLKPGNIMLTKSGAKLMDFGLAKPEFAVPSAAVGPFTPSSPTMNLGALTSAASPLTMKGSFVGTCQYMAPEVLQGAAADARSDIFSFGCLLYEMVAGKQAFEAKTQLGVLTAILEHEPTPLSVVKPGVPAAVDYVVNGCLVKDPAERFQSMHDVLMNLRGIAATDEDKREAATPIGKSLVAAIVIAAIVLIAAAGWAGEWWAKHNEPVMNLRAEIAPPDTFQLDSTGDAGGMPVLSPQGDKIAFVAHSATTKSLWVRSLESDSATQLDGTQNAMHPFWSPDGKSIGFFANGKLKKISASGGSATALADVTTPRGGSWGDGDVILYSESISDGLKKVDANGGPSSVATSLDGTGSDTHRWPWFMPDGKHFVYLAISHNTADASLQGIYFGSIDSNATHFVLATNAGAQYANGYLLYKQGNDLVAQPFDPVAGKLSGTSTPLINNVRNDSGVWRSVFSVSQNGLMLYQSGSAGGAATRMAWFDRTGKELSQVSGGENTAIDIRLSPDGKRVAQAETSGIWVQDLERKTRTRVTFGGQLSEEPSWSPDGKNIVFATNLTQGPSRTLNAELRSVPADGSGTETKLGNAKSVNAFPAWSPDGKYLAFVSKDDTGRDAVMIQAVGSGEPPKVMIRTPIEKARFYGMRISPDSRWLAFSSDETGQEEVYITRFPEGTGKWRVSTNFGSYPAWAKGGKELFYKDFNDDFFVCPIGVQGNDLVIGIPQQLLHANQPGLGLGFDVAADGERLLINLAEDEVATPLKIVTNWPALLKK
jgi:serine/threonine protein kinase/WD40 repeat protein